MCRDPMGAGRFFSDPGKGLVKLEFGSLCSLTDSVRCGSSMEMCHKESTVQKVDVTDMLKKLFLEASGSHIFEAN